MITGLDGYRLDAEEQKYYDAIQQQMSEVGATLGCTFEMAVLDINQCHLLMKGDKRLVWKQITVDGVPYILDALLQQHQGKPLDQDQIETLHDARVVEDE